MKYGIKKNRLRTLIEKEKKMKTCDCAKETEVYYLDRSVTPITLYKQNPGCLSTQNI